jgi:hypothetical protein
MPSISTLKSRHDTRRATEVAIAIKSLNRMNQLGRAMTPTYAVKKGTRYR